MNGAGVAGRLPRRCAVALIGLLILVGRVGCERL